MTMKLVLTSRGFVKLKKSKINVKVFDPFVDKKIIEKKGAEKLENLLDGLKNADFVSLHVPLTNETKNLIKSLNLVFDVINSPNIF